MSSKIKQWNPDITKVAIDTVNNKKMGTYKEYLNDMRII